MSYDSNKCFVLCQIMFYSLLNRCKMHNDERISAIVFFFVFFFVCFFFCFFFFCCCCCFFRMCWVYMRAVILSLLLLFTYDSMVILESRFGASNIDVNHR